MKTESGQERASRSFPRWPLYTALLLLLAAGLLRVSLFHQRLHAPLASDGDPTLLVMPGQSFGALVTQLEARGLLRAAGDLRLYARFTGQAGRMQAGEYALEEGLSPLGLFAKLLRGEVLYRQVRLLEGWTSLQALAAVQADPYVSSTIEADSPEALAQALGLEVHAEGQFFPDTYNFTRGSSDREILLRAHQALRAVLAEEWEARAANLPYAGPQEALVMASLVEKETGVAAERREIAGVFVRRLRSGMRLQTDPSVIYGLGAAFDGNLTRADLRADSPYNTYLHSGLPPTPIALAGRAAIEASLHPADGDSLYFVAKGDGTHHFSATLDEHEDAVRRYQVENRAENYVTQPPISP